jgi:hypothetical protein
MTQTTDASLVERLRRTGRGVLPVNPDGPAAADTIEAQARRIEALEGALRAAFVGWIADRFQKRSGVPLGRDDALKSAAGCMASFETLTSVRLGDPDHGWSEDDAHAIADDEIDTCWESAA